MISISNVGTVKSEMVYSTNVQTLDQIVKGWNMKVLHLKVAKSSSYYCTLSIQSVCLFLIQSYTL